MSRRASVRELLFKAFFRCLAQDMAGLARAGSVLDTAHGSSGISFTSRIAKDLYEVQNMYETCQVNTNFH